MGIALDSRLSVSATGWFAWFGVSSGYCGNSRNSGC